MPVCVGYSENKHCLKSARIWRFSGLYSVWIRENMDQKNSEYRHSSRSESPKSFYNIILGQSGRRETNLIIFYFNEMKSFLKAVLLVYNRLIEKLSMLTFKSKFIINGTCLYPFF